MAMNTVNPGAQMTIDTTVAALEGNLKESSRSMVQFSVNLKALFNESQVTSNAQTKDFIQLRDNTRKNAAVYTTQVLPLSESVVKKIGDFTAYFEHLEFEDWVECLDDLIKECTEGAADCDILQQMHQGLIKSLNEDAGKAIVAKETLEMTAKNMEWESEKNWIAGIGLGVLGAVATVGTCGAAVVVIGAAAAGEAVLGAGLATAAAGEVGWCANLSKEAITSSVAYSQNAKITRKNIDLTDSSIQAMQNFISGLMGLSSFFKTVKEKLERMKRIGDKGARENFYKMMKKVAKGIDGNCMLFLSVAEMMRVKLDSIPFEISDKNYVDKWLREQKAEFKRQRGQDWGGLSRPGWSRQLRSIADN